MMLAPRERSKPSGWPLATFEKTGFGRASVAVLSGMLASVDNEGSVAADLGLGTRQGVLGKYSAGIKDGA